jgi:hypothetical protein
LHACFREVRTAASSVSCYILVVTYLSILNLFIMTMLIKLAMREQGSKSVRPGTRNLTHLLVAWGIGNAHVVNCLMQKGQIIDSDLKAKFLQLGYTYVHCIQARDALDLNHVQLQVTTIHVPSSLAAYKSD